MTTLKSIELSAVIKQLNTPPLKQIALKLERAQQLEKLSVDDLTKILNVLSGVNRTKPVLYSAKQKLKQANLRAKVPTKNPNMWPKVFRQMKKVNGVVEGQNHQHYRLNPTALPTNLNKLHAWNQTSQTDLIIVGPVSSIVNNVNRAPLLAVTNDMASSNETDGSLAHDLKYGDTISRTNKESMATVRAANPVPTFWITCDAKSQITDAKGEVVLDPMKDLVDMAGGAISGLAGGFSVAAPAIIDILKTANDSADLISDPAEKVITKARAWIAKNKNKVFTITVGIGDMSDRKSSFNTQRTSLDHNQLVAAICAALSKKM